MRKETEGVDWRQTHEGQTTKAEVRKMLRLTRAYIIHGWRFGNFDL
ncbi:MAG: hypothetical protein IPH40_12675 [Polaromonas sp.]|nr:hypothetical protein [Polaromonas sp.]